jgi:DUF2938 family protein
LTIETTHIVGAILVGLGATLVMDLWALFLRRVFDIRSLNYCLLGRWLRTIPEGTIVHDSIAAAPEKRYECTTGWIAHYLIGATFALAFVSLTSGRWLERPTLWPALAFAIVTTLVPFLVLQPSFGLGIAASRTPKPNQARLKSLMTHTVFGLGLYLCALLWSQLLFRR